MAGLTCHGGRSLAGVRLRVTACAQGDPSRVGPGLTSVRQVPLLAWARAVESYTSTPSAEGTYKYK